VRLRPVFPLLSRSDVEDWLNRIVCEERSFSDYLQNSQFQAMHLRNLTLQQALLIQQEMRVKGGEALVPRHLMRLQPEESYTLLLLGTHRQYQEVIESLKRAPFHLPNIAEEMEVSLLRCSSPPPPLTVGPIRLDFSRGMYYMGVLNVTPDSFYDGGKYVEVEKAVERAEQMIEEGAHIIDIGGESTRPGADPVPAEIEMERVLPVIERLRRHTDHPISIDTYKARVAEAAVRAGANMVNDISGLTLDEAMLSTISSLKVPYVLNHIIKTPKTMMDDASYTDVLVNIYDFFEQQIQRLLQAGVREEDIVIDPGIGFGKSVYHILTLLHYLAYYRVFGRPILVGVSRKSFIGTIYGDYDEDRLVGSVAATVVARAHGAHIARTHDVKATRLAMRVAELLLRGKWKV